MTTRPSPAALLRATRGTTLIELISALSVMALIVSSLYLLLGAGIKGRLIVHARVSDQERGRQALMWLADRVRQVNYDPQAACSDGLLLAGSGSGFDQRLAFRAIVDEDLTLPRRTYVYYTQDRTLWQEWFSEETGDPCFAETTRSAPDPQRVALTPRIVQTFELTYLDGRGTPATSVGLVRSIGVTLRLDAPSTPGRMESQTYRTLVTIRGP